MAPLVVRAVRGLLLELVGRIRPVRGCIKTLGEVCEVVILLAFPIFVINFQHIVTKLDEGFEARKVKETVLDMFGQSFVSCMSKGGVIPLGTSGSSGKVYEVVCGSVTILHDYFFELYFCL